MWLCRERRTRAGLPTSCIQSPIPSNEMYLDEVDRRDGRGERLFLLSVAYSRFRAHEYVHVIVKNLENASGV